MECKVCLKKFRNGKALGAHMRSHYAILPLPTTHKQQQPTTTHSTSSLFFSHEDDDDCGIKTTCYYGLREKPNKSLRRIADLKTFFDDSTRAHNKNVFSVFTEEEEEEEEDVALCLLMLSRDVWGGSTKHYSTQPSSSSQGLGTHMTTTHFKKIKNLDSVVDVQQNNNKKKKNIVKQEKEVHQCPLCSRKFNSAQALGGHKRWHLLLAQTPSLNVSQYPSIDLNLPRQD